MTRNLSSKAKMELLRDGKNIYIILEFPDEYAAMNAFDVWSMEDIDFSFKGPKRIQETDRLSKSVKGY